MAITPREELLQIQKRLWKKNKELIEDSIFVKEPGFVSYEKKYLNAVKAYDRVATHDEMLSAIKNSDIIYVGDYHTCNQSQRSFLRILKAVIKEENNLALGLELIYSKYQKLLNQFMNDEISEDAFLKKIGLHQRWVFDLWGSFKPLFEFAKYHKLLVLGIDAAPMNATVVKRDQLAARLIAKFVFDNPGKKLFILIGDLHLAHLPDLVQKEIAKIDDSKKFRDVVLYQNSESIYWKLADQQLEDRVEVVKISDREYCRMHTPPIVCQQSYLNWLDHEEGEIDYSDAKSSFLELIDQITGFLQINIGNDRDKVDVYTCGDLSFFDKLRSSGEFSAKELKNLKKQIMANESYYIPERHIVYLANLSINHAAEEAAHFIKHVCAGKEFARTREDAFYTNILHEGLAFFGSKLINHKRKCFHEKDFENLISYFNTIRVPQERMLEFETSHLVIEFLKEGRNLGEIRSMKVFKPEIFFSVTHALGYMLGDKLFYAMMSERISKEEIRTLFYDNWKREGEPVLAYNDLCKKLKGVKTPKRI